MIITRIIVIIFCLGGGGKTDQHVYWPTKKHWDNYWDGGNFKLLQFVWIGNFAKFADKGLCASTESSDLLATSPVGMSD